MNENEKRIRYLENLLKEAEDWVHMLTSSTNDEEEQNQMLDWLEKVREIKS